MGGRNRRRNAWREYILQMCPSRRTSCPPALPPLPRTPRKKAQGSQSLGPLAGRPTGRSADSESAYGGSNPSPRMYRRRPACPQNPRRMPMRLHATSALVRRGRPVRAGRRVRFPPNRLITPRRRFDNQIPLTRRMPMRVHWPPVGSNPTRAETPRENSHLSRRLTNTRRRMPMELHP